MAGWSDAAEPARGGRPHGEVLAFAEAGELARGATLYVSLEPCSHHGKTPPCADAVIDAGVARVVAAIADPNPLVAGRGFSKLRQVGIEVETDVLAEAASRVHSGHFTRITAGRSTSS
jgi:diaminohydroxyphosphoribosylaminopyrimidine deaminase/5-amino-6-(5-phosphoribosylamino)uracil reductase